MTVESFAHSGIYTVNEAAALLNVSTFTVRREIAAGHLRARRIRRCVRITAEEIERYKHAENEAQAS